MRKKSLFVVGIILLSHLFASCSGDESYLFSFEDETFSRSDNLAYLTYDSNANNDSIMILSQAMSRLSYKMENGRLLIEQSNGAAVNISEDLYNYILNSCNYLNSVTTASRKVIRRTVSNNPESVDNTCVGAAISYMCGIPESRVNSMLAQFDNNYYVAGIAEEDLLDAVRLFKSDARYYNNASSAPTNGIAGMNVGHAANIIGTDVVNGKKLITFYERGTSYTWEVQGFVIPIKHAITNVEVIKMYIH